MIKTPFVSIVVLNYNGMHLLKECLDSLYETIYPQDKIRIIVVDNASSDGSEAFIKNNYPEVKIVKSKKNIGVVANNLGVEFAINKLKSEYVVLLNNDVVVKRDWLSELVKVAESDTSIGACGPTVLNSDGTVQSLGGTVDPLGTPCLIIQHKTNGVVDVSWVSACCILLRSEAIKKLEYLVDQRFFIFYDEIDYCWRLKYQGYKTVFVPKSHVTHKGSKTIKIGNKKYNRFIMEHYKNKILTFKKNFRTPLRQMFLIPIFLTTLFLTSYWALRNQWGYGISILNYFFIKEKQTRGLDKISLKRQLSLFDCKIL